jgi:hypothetical protein
MAGYTGLNFAGTMKVVSDPVLAYAKDGKGYLKLRALEKVNGRGPNDSGVMFYGVTLFNERMAENLAAGGIAKGDTIEVVGRVGAFFPKREGQDENAFSLDITATSVSHSAIWSVTSAGIDPSEAAEEKDDGDLF